MLKWDLINNMDIMLISGTELSLFNLIQGKYCKNWKYDALKVRNMLKQKGIVNLSHKIPILITFNNVDDLKIW